MAIGTYSELQTAIAGWLAKSNLSTYIPDFIALAEAEFRRELRIREMETTTTITVNAQRVSLPTNYLGARRFYLDQNPALILKYIPPEQMFTMWAGSMAGRPQFFTIEGDQFVFGPTPETSYNGELLYYQAFPSLSDVQTTNELLTIAPDLYLYASLEAAKGFLQDDARLATWGAMKINAMRQLTSSDQRDRYSGSALVPRTDIGNP